MKMNQAIRLNDAATPLNRSCWHVRIPIILLVLLFSALVSRAEELSAKETATAQKLYTAKCAKCHKFYDPQAYNQADWDMWMRKMKRKSKLKDEQFQLLCRYLNNIRAEKEAETKSKQGLNGSKPSNAAKR